MQKRNNTYISDNHKKAVNNLRLFYDIRTKCF